ncbi:hypothetical protein ATANTOWER_006440 [Ataeniobius toweri]|uniref:Uncharacterized protein n=1 Tax=Ataeniobius toweri TaxID=208326 RepID=A0ABU7C926_9TELE|nr:hypothetical protein [Ataeniobius toweri]
MVPCGWDLAPMKTSAAVFEESLNGSLFQDLNNISQGWEILAPGPSSQHWGSILRGSSTFYHSLSTCFVAAGCVLADVAKGKDVLVIFSQIRNKKHRRSERGIMLHLWGSLFALLEAVKLMFF